MLEQTKQVADLVVDIVIASAKAREDGKLTVLDGRFFIPVLTSIIPGVKGISEVPVELVSDTNAEEIIKEYIKEKLLNEVPEDELLDDIAVHLVDMTINLIQLSDNLKQLRAKA